MLTVVCLLTAQLKTLHQPASRLLIAALMLFASTYPRTLVHSVIVPVISNELCNAFQADVVLKLVKAVLSTDHHAELLRSDCCDFGVEIKLVWKTQPLAAGSQKCAICQMLTTFFLTYLLSYLSLSSRMDLLPLQARGSKR